MGKGHLAEYAKDIEKAKKNGGDDDDLDEEPNKRSANKVVARVIAATMPQLAEMR